MDLSLKNRTAIVTGGGRGLGRAICKVLACEGANVIVADISEENANRTALILKDQGGRSQAVHIDVTDLGKVRQVFEGAVKEYGQVDILINNAGLTRMNSFMEITSEEFNQVFDINAYGTFICCQEFAKLAIAGSYSASIVNIASNAGKVGFQNQLHYNAAKAAVINMTRNLAEELAPYNINVNAVCPGAVETEMLFEVAKSFASSDEDEEAKEIMNSFAVPQLGRLIQPEEVARIVVFLASDNSIIIRGQSINVDGGATPY